MRNKTKTEAPLPLPLFFPGKNSLIFPWFFSASFSTKQSMAWEKGVAASPPPSLLPWPWCLQWLLSHGLFFLIVFSHSCCTAVLSFIKYVITEAPKEPAGPSMVQPQPLLTMATPQDWLWSWRNQLHWNTQQDCKYFFCCDSELKLLILLSFAQIALKMFISVLIVFISTQ